MAGDLFACALDPLFLFPLIGYRQARYDTHTHGRPQPPAPSPRLDDLTDALFAYLALLIPIATLALGRAAAPAWPPALRH